MKSIKFQIVFDQAEHKLDINWNNKWNRKYKLEKLSSSLSPTPWMPNMSHTSISAILIFPVTVASYGKCQIVLFINYVLF